LSRVIRGPDGVSVLKDDPECGSKVRGRTGKWHMISNQQQRATVVYPLLYGSNFHCGESGMRW
jgi:hypothetical protein